MIRRDIHEANRLSWNAATAVHNAHKRDQAAFLRGGGSTLFPEEKELLGELRGKRLVHLQCNSGQDTLSLAALGAEVTGVDISDEAIDFARRLSADSGLPGAFARADLFDWFAAAPAGAWDVAFASYGAIQWLTDLRAYAEGIAKVLAPGGIYVLVEFHPISNVLDDRGNPVLPYFGGAPVATGGVPDYVAEGLAPMGFVPAHEGWKNPHPDASVAWTVADLVTALIGAGLRLDALREWPHANGCRLVDTLVPAGGNRFLPAPGTPQLPLMLGLRARRG